MSYFSPSKRLCAAKRCRLRAQCLLAVSAADDERVRSGSTFQYRGHRGDERVHPLFGVETADEENVRAICGEVEFFEQWRGVGFAEFGAVDTVADYFGAGFLGEAFKKFARELGGEDKHRDLGIEPVQVHVHQRGKYVGKPLRLVVKGVEKQIFRLGV